MGYSSYSHDAAASLHTSYKGKTASTIFTNITKIDSEMDPLSLKIRECRDSALHPNSVAIRLDLDVTGSMREVPVYLIKYKFGTMIETMLKHKVMDCAVMFGAIGDHEYDKFPLQVGQFESGTLELDKWLKGINREGGGGGNDGESYLLSWLIAARHTSIDCFEKRGRKGYSFTIGDEKTLLSISASKLKDLLGYSEASTLTAEQLLKEAQQSYNVYHIHVKGYTNEDGVYSETSNGSDPGVIKQWQGLLGQNLIVLDDANNIAETIASIVVVMEGANKTDVLAGLGAAAGSVSNALININNATGITGASVIEF
jgi:hypothetical protein